MNDIEQILSQVVAAAFDSQEWNYSSKRIEEKGKSIFNINFTYEGKGQLKCKIHAFDDGVCDIENTLPMECPEQYRFILCFYLTKINFTKRYGTYRMDVDDGEIQFSYSFKASADTKSEDFLKIFKNTKNGAMDDEEFNKIKSYCCGRFDALEIQTMKAQAESLSEVKSEDKDEQKREPQSIEIPQSSLKLVGGNKHKLKFF